MRSLVIPVAVALALGAAAPAVAQPSPRVRVEAQACTTEPSPRRAIVRVRRAPSGALRVRAVLDGERCDSVWQAGLADDRLELSAHAADPDRISACGTCALTLRVDGLARGWLTVAVDGTEVRARVR